MSEIPRRRHFRPGLAGTLVGAHEHAAALLADVDFALEIDGVQLLLLAGQLRHVTGNEVLMLHGKYGQLDAHHAAHLARPQAPGVHHMLGMNIAVIGDHIPGSVGARLEVRDPGMPDDLGAADLRGFRIGMSHTVRIDVSLDGIVHGTREVFLVQERKQFRRFIDRNDLQVHAEISAARLGHLQPVEALAGAGQHDAAGNVDSAGLT